MIQLTYQDIVLLFGKWYNLLTKILFCYSKN